MREKQVMKSFQNYPFNFFYCAVETSRISLAWSIMGRSESLCEGAGINFWKHQAEAINVKVGALCGFLMFSSWDWTVQGSFKFPSFDGFKRKCGKGRTLKHFCDFSFKTIIETFNDKQLLCWLDLNFTVFKRRHIC